MRTACSRIWAPYSQRSDDVAPGLSPMYDETDLSTYAAALAWQPLSAEVYESSADLETLTEHPLAHRPLYPGHLGDQDGLLLGDGRRHGALGLRVADGAEDLRRLLLPVPEVAPEL